MKKIILILLFIPFLLGANQDDSAPLNIRETDGSPSTYPYQLKVTNGTLTDNGDGTVSLATGGGGSESTTVSDTTTINLTLTGSDITADGLYTAGDALTLTGADFDFDGGTTPGGSLGGTWASPTIDDLFVLNSAADTMLGNLTITSTDAAIILDETAATDTDFWIANISDSAGDDDDKFQIGDGTVVGTNPFLTIDTSGNVGIGTTGPGALLDIGTAGTSLGKVRLSGNTSGNVTLQPNAVAGTDIVLTLPATTGTLVTGGGTASGTNTGDNTVATTGDSATSFFSSGTLEVAIGGTGTTTSTGTGAVVLGTSPTFTTPNLGAVAAGSTWSLADTITALSVYTSTTSLEETTGATDSGGYIVGLFDEFAFSAGTDVQTVMDDLDAAIPDYYQYTLLPESATLDDGAPPAITVIESTGTNTPRFRVADFDPTTDEIIYWTFIVPDDMAAGNWLADVSWYSNDLGANETCVWGLAISATSEADADTMAEQAAPTIDYASEDVNTTEVNRLIQTTITISDLDSVAAGDIVTLCFRRDADSTGGTDDLSSDSRLVAVRLRIPRT